MEGIVSIKPKKSADKQVTIMHQNVDRVSNKIDRLNHLLNLTSPDILILTEHGVDRSTICQLRLIGYTLISAFSREHNIKGGVAIFKSNLLENDVSSLKVEDISIPRICEMSAITVKISCKEQLVILGVYRPPSRLRETTNQAFTAIDEVLESHFPSSCQKVLIGDINIDDNIESVDKRGLNELLATHNMTRVKLPATRITKDHSSSIDAVCSNIHPEDLQVEVIQTGISDHTGQLCKLCFPVAVKGATVTTRRILNQNSLMDLKVNLASESWDNVLQSENVEEAYNNFLQTFTMNFNHSCPQKRKRNLHHTKNLVQYDYEVTTLRKDFLKANDKFCTSGSDVDKTHAANLKKSYDLKLRALRREKSAAHIENASNKSKAIWDMINSERNPQKKRTDTFTHINHEGRKVEDPRKIAEVFNSYFVSIADETL